MGGQRSILPFRLGRQAAPRPGAVGLRFIQIDVAHGFIRRQGRALAETHGAPLCCFAQPVQGRRALLLHQPGAAGRTPELAVLVAAVGDKIGKLGVRYGAGIDGKWRHVAGIRRRFIVEGKPGPTRRAQFNGATWKSDLARPRRQSRAGRQRFRRFQAQPLQTGQHFLATQVFMRQGQPVRRQGAVDIGFARQFIEHPVEHFTAIRLHGARAGQFQLPAHAVLHHIGIKQIVAAGQQRVINGVGRMAGSGFAQDEPLGKPGDVRKLPQGRIEARMTGHACHHVQAGSNVTVEQR
ncbi:hypothetical protein D3C87_991780 [compost metagenome]